jgi:TolB-like protein
MAVAEHFSKRRCRQGGARADRILRVIVLPFTANEVTGDGTARRLADQITEDLTNDLSRTPPLRVIARQTARVYAGRQADVAAIGAELGVRYVVEGSVQFQAPQLRVNVALIDAKTRLQVWSDRFERDYSDRFSVQDEIVRGVARVLHLNVLAAEDRRRPLNAPRDAGIDALLNKGWQAMSLVNISSSAGGRKTISKKCCGAIRTMSLP